MFCKKRKRYKNLKKVNFKRLLPSDVTLTIEKVNADSVKMSLLLFPVKIEIKPSLTEVHCGIDAICSCYSFHFVFVALSLICLFENIHIQYSNFHQF